MRAPNNSKTVTDETICVSMGAGLGLTYLAFPRLKRGSVVEKSSFQISAQWLESDAVNNRTAFPNISKLVTGDKPQ